jgi:uncharacterized metal-binding protein YceD (DUF177 family)
MQNPLKIYVDRLTRERTEKIEEFLTPEIMDVNENDLKFQSSIKLKGRAYIAEDHLVIQLEVETDALIPCAICNNGVKKKIIVKGFYHTEDLEKIQGHVYDYTDPLREAVLLEIPSYVECLENCPKRTDLKNYLQKGNDQFPFADLN